jgi:hypothetical protein
MQYVLITLGTFLVFMLLLLELTGGTFRTLVGFFVEELDENRVPLHPVRLSLKHGDAPASAPEPSPALSVPADRFDVVRERKHTVTAILTHKIDERKRVIDSNGHSTTYDEYYEMVFETKDGTSLRLVAPKVAHKETPFNQDGILTYAGDQFISFRYSKPKY